MVFEMLFGSKEYFVSEPEDFMEDASLSRAALNPGAGTDLYRIGSPNVENAVLDLGGGKTRRNVPQSERQTP